jgi:inner membrane protein
MEQSISFFDRHRILIKGLLIGFLTLLMLIPTVLIDHLVSERAERQQQVVSEVSSKWASAQTVTGPILMVPYMQTSKSGDGKEITARKLAYFLPEQLSINGQASPEVRKRSLYQVMLYRSSLQLEGSFAPLPLKSLYLAPEQMLWNEARLAVGITDAIGLEEEVAFKWGDSAGKMEAGVPENGALTSGLSIPVTVNPAGATAFSVSLRLRGSENLYFTPVGKTTDVTLQSSWQHPAFDGSYLPSSPAEISKSGFNAHWRVLASSRAYPQAWRDNQVDLQASNFGVRLIQPADGYVKTSRSVKYAILFIALTFAIFFFLELLQKRQVHPLQYLLVGFALCIFYTLLLSISEYTGFNIAYGIAATAVVSLISLYVWGLFHSVKTALGFTAALSGLYTYIYILIQLEDYALLCGSIGLFVIVAILMYASRKVDWYGTERPRLATAEAS